MICSSPELCWYHTRIALQAVHGKPRKFGGVQPRAAQRYVQPKPCGGCLIHPGAKPCWSTTHKRVINCEDDNVTGGTRPRIPRVPKSQLVPTHRHMARITAKQPTQRSSSIYNKVQSTPGVADADTHIWAHGVCPHPRTPCINPIVPTTRTPNHLQASRHHPYQQPTIADPC